MEARGADHLVMPLADELAAAWPTLATGLGCAGIGGVVAKLFDTRRASKRDQSDVMMDIIKGLRRDMRILRVEQRHERIICDLNLKVMRHRLNNVDGSLDAMLMLVEKAPEQAASFATMVKVKRSEQREVEGAERAAVIAAEAAKAAELEAIMNAPEDEDEHA